MSDNVSRRTARTATVPLSIVFVQLVCLAGCGSDKMAGKSQSAERSLPTLEAEVVTVEPVLWPRIVRSQGSLVADETAVVGAKVSGRVAEVHVDLGDFLRKGSPLATLDDSEFRLQVAQAEAQLAQARSAVGLQPDDPVSGLDAKNAPPVREARAQWDEAKANLKRARTLLERRAVTTSEIEQMTASEHVAQARHASALNSVQEKIALIGVREAELSLARQRLEDTVIRMPFDGLVQQRQAAPGAYIQIGDSVATVVRNDPLRFRGTLPERHAQHVAVGQQAQLTIESVAEPLSVRISRISPALNRLNRSLLFEATVQNSDRRLRAGLFGEADVVIDPRAEPLAVPKTAVVEFAGAVKVWKVVDGESVEQAVLTGERRNGRIEIIEGLEQGDVILVDGSQGTVATVVARHVTVPAVASPDVEPAEESSPAGDVPAGEVAAGEVAAGDDRVASPAEETATSE